MTCKPLLSAKVLRSKSFRKKPWAKSARSPGREWFPPTGSALLPRDRLLTVRCGPIGRRSCRQPGLLFFNGPDGAYSRDDLTRCGVSADYSPVHSLVNQILNQPDPGPTAIHRPSDIVGGVPADDLPPSRHTGVHFEGSEHIAPKPDCDNDGEQSHDQPPVMGARFGHVPFPFGCRGAVPLVIETCLPLKAMRLLADLLPWIPGLVSKQPGFGPEPSPVVGRPQLKRTAVAPSGLN